MRTDMSFKILLVSDFSHELAKSSRKYCFATFDDPSLLLVAMKNEEVSEIGNPAKSLDNNIHIVSNPNIIQPN